MRVQNEQELGNAVKQEESCIELEGKLASHVKKLMKLKLWKRNIKIYQKRL